jgi:hypothetical protein
MHLRTEEQQDLVAVPLRTAVLCVDCESVSISRFETCPVCGSHSVFSIAPILGGSILPPPESSARDASLVRFDLAISIVLKRMEAKDVNTTLEGITDLIRFKLGQSRVSIHIDVEPVSTAVYKDVAKAA